MAMAVAANVGVLLFVVGAAAAAWAVRAQIQAVSDQALPWLGRLPDRARGSVRARVWWGVAGFAVTVAVLLLAPVIGWWVVGVGVVGFLPALGLQWIHNRNVRRGHTTTN